MHVTRNITRFATAVIAVTLTMGAVPTADAFPDKSIRLIVGFPPGGSSDAMARIVQQGLEKQLGQPVVIENKPGAGAMIAVDQVAKAAPDGYTLGLGGAGALGSNLGLPEKMPYDPRKDIAPVSGLAGSPFLLAAAPSLKGKSLRDIIALAKADPGKLVIGHGGNGTLMHLSAEMLNQMAGLKIALVPYRGIAPVVNDLIGGHVALGIVDRRRRWRPCRPARSRPWPSPRPSAFPACPRSRPSTRPAFPASSRTAGSASSPQAPLRPT
jgi:tripartite-type tricarboxylate transporter receptor subunit TctC